MVALTRSENMARIKGRDTSPEHRLRRAFWAIGLRYRKQKRIEGVRPDIVFLGPRIAVFVDGCFWHGCPVHYVRPRSRTDFWSLKLMTNVKRDIRQTAMLESRGWKVLRFWEHEVDSDLGRVISEVRRAVNGGEPVVGGDMRVIRVVPETGEGNLEDRHLVSLRDLTLRRVIQCVRLTTKWKRTQGPG
jgi:DNA mismatch endonuclease, patch repair protein